MSSYLDFCFIFYINIYIEIFINIGLSGTKISNLIFLQHESILILPDYIYTVCVILYIFYLFYMYYKSEIIFQILK